MYGVIHTLSLDESEMNGQTLTILISCDSYTSFTRIPMVDQVDFIRDDKHMKTYHKIKQFKSVQIDKPNRT